MIFYAYGMAFRAFYRRWKIEKRSAPAIERKKLEGAFRFSRVNRRTGSLFNSSEKRNRVEKRAGHQVSEGVKVEALERAWLTTRRGYAILGVVWDRRMSTMYSPLPSASNPVTITW